MKEQNKDESNENKKTTSTKLSLEETIELIKTGRKAQHYKKNVKHTFLYKCEVECDACGYVTPLHTPGEWIWETKINDHSNEDYKAICSDCYNDYKVLAGWKYHICCF